jgi:ribosomal protection tetracycline resistance protein
MGAAQAVGTAAASVTPYGMDDAHFSTGLLNLLAHHDEGVVAEYLDRSASLPYNRLRGELASQTGHALVHRVFFGSAITGAGVNALIDGITELLPTTEGRTEDAVSGTVFKVERGSAARRWPSCACALGRHEQADQDHQLDACAAFRPWRDDAGAVGGAWARC